MNSMQEDERLLNAMTETYKNCQDVSIKKDGFFMPAIMIKSHIFGNKVVSLPFMDVGGLFGKIDADAIKKFAEEHLKRGEVRYIEIKLNEFQENAQHNLDLLKKIGFEEKASKEQFYIIVENPNFKWEKFHKHTRNDVRKAEKSGLTIKKIDNNEELFNFYGLYFNEMKRFGTPCHKADFFYNLFRHFKGDFFGLNCYLGKKIIASGIVIFEDEVSYLWFNVSNPKYRINKPNDLIYWKIINEAFKRGSKFIDAGQIDSSSDDEREIGLLKFKEKWLGSTYKKSVLYYSKESSLSNKEEKKGELKKFKNIWSLLPSPIIKLIGPKITSQLGI